MNTKDRVLNILDFILDFPAIIFYDIKRRIEKEIYFYKLKRKDWYD
jgi:hypothetical protein